MKFSDQMKTVRASKHVHSTWYRETYPDVAALKLDPATHYLRYGAAMGRNPGKNFDTRFYLDSYPEVAGSGMNPLLYYALHGRGKGHDTRPPRQPEPRRQINELRGKLLKLGFIDVVLQELEGLVTDAPSTEMQALAARELALWHMRARTQDGYRTALAYLDRAYVHAPGLEFRSKLSMCRLLCHHHLGDHAGAQLAYEKAALAAEATADVMLAWANCQRRESTRLMWINEVLRRFGIAPVALLPDTGLSLYDRLTCTAPLPRITGGPKVSVLIAAYDAAAILPTALRSLQEQTWTNLEILVIDDCSPTPDTVAVAERFAAADPRIRVIAMERNGGAYVARNRGLDVATGDFVTLHDADDWSHPGKIETQVRFMEQSDDVIACTSEQARATPDLIFGTMRGVGDLVSSNTSSLLFRRQEMRSRLGHWDTTRFGADGELLRRLRTAFGAQAIVDLDTGPLSFQRATPDSATGDPFFGYEGYKFGVRRAYEELTKVRLDDTDAVYLPDTATQRVFYAPRPMRSKRPADHGERRHYDVIIASDFRFPGGTSSSNAEEIKAQSRAGLRTGLVELYCYTINTSRQLNPKVVEQLQEDRTELVVYGEEASCDLLIIRQPMVLDPIMQLLPEIDARAVRVIVNQPPKMDYGSDSPDLFDLKTCAQNVTANFGQPGVWHPIGPLVRDALEKHHAGDLSAIELSPDDWTNIIDMAEWQRPQRPVFKDRPIRICRHSRDGYVKWPSSPEVIAQAYPEAEDIEIHVLGGGKTPAKVLGGRLPGNWHVTDFGAVPPAEFLAQHDIFVYFTHPDWIESFGRAIFEPMCVGLPVILPVGLGYEKLFGEAALYARPDEVAGIARKLMADPALYEAQVQRAFRIVGERFSFDTHIRRLAEAGVHQAAECAV